MLQHYVLERLLDRLAQSPHRGRFLLKGALLLNAWHAPVSRPTRDIDLLGYAENDVAVIEAMFREVCELSVVDDGLRFDASTLVGSRIKEDADYQPIASQRPRHPSRQRASVRSGRASAAGTTMQTPPRKIAAFASRAHVIGSSPAGADLIFTAGNFLIFLGGPLPGDEQIAAVRLDQYLNALGEGIVIPGQAKYVSIFNVSGSVVNARARLQYEIF